MKKIKLTQGKYVLVDDEDFDWLNQWKWLAFDNNGHFYAARRPKSGIVFMHRLILESGKGNIVDHANQDTLDNRRSNIRLCTRAENQANRGSSKGSASIYKGVTWDKRGKKWCAAIKVDGKSIALGRFEDEVEAAKAYDKKHIEVHAEFACPNF